MKYRAVYLELAAKDVAEIRDYLSQFYPDTPVRFLAALKQGVERLCDNPLLYARYEDNLAYRKMTLQGHLVFYKVLEADGIVEIHRVLHGMRDIKTHLPQKQPN